MVHPPNPQVLDFLSGYDTPVGGLAVAAGGVSSAGTLWKAVAFSGIWSR